MTDDTAPDDDDLTFDEDLDDEDVEETSPDEPFTEGPGETDDGAQDIPAGGRPLVHLTEPEPDLEMEASDGSEEVNA